MYTNIFIYNIFMSRVFNRKMIRFITHLQVKKRFLQ